VCVCVCLSVCVFVCVFVCASTQHGVGFGQVRDAMVAADDAELAELGSGLLSQLRSQDCTTSAFNLFDFATRGADTCKRLLELSTFCSQLEESAGQSSASDDDVTISEGRPQINCRAAMRLLRTRTSLQKEHTFECATGNTRNICAAGVHDNTKFRVFTLR
jgi:hypothetical protein